MYAVIKVHFEITQAEDINLFLAVDTDYVGKDKVAN